MYTKQEENDRRTKHMVPTHIYTHIQAYHVYIHTYTYNTAMQSPPATIETMQEMPNPKAPHPRPPRIHAEWVQERGGLVEVAPLAMDRSLIPSCLSRGKCECYS